MSPPDRDRLGTLHGGWHDNAETLALLAVATLIVLAIVTVVLS